MADIPELVTNIHRLSIVLGRIGDNALQTDCGYGMSQFKILWVLMTHEEGVLQTTIASWLNQTEAAISRQVGLLDEEGLITKQVDPQTRRNHIVRLSTKGKKLATNAMSVLAKEYKPNFAVLSDNEQELLNALLEKVFYTVCARNLED